MNFDSYSKMTLLSIVAMFICWSVVCSFVIHYLIDERNSPNGRVQFVSEKQGHKHLGLVCFDCFSMHIITDIIDIILIEICTFPSLVI